MVSKSSPALRAMLAFLLFWVAAVGRAQAAEIYKVQWVTSGNTHIPLIQIGFPDGTSRQFILDTAAFTTVIDRSVAAELNLPARRAYPNDPTNTMEYVVCSVNLGPDVLPLKGVPFVLTDLSVIRRLHPNVAGTIGTNVLSGYSLRMDYSKKQLELIPGSVKGTPNEPTEAEKLSLTKSKSTYSYMVAGSLDGVKIDFLLATGAEYTFIGDPDVAQKLTPRASISENNVVTGAGAQSPGGAQAAGSHLAQFGEFKIGKLTIKNPLAQRTTAAYSVNGIGDDILRRFRIVIDYPGQTLYLTPDPTLNEKPATPAAAGHVP
jgi:hypothetical protein